MNDARKGSGLEVAASLVLVASAFSFVGACIAYALDNRAGVWVGGLLCALLFVASNRLQQRRPGAQKQADGDTAAAETIPAEQLYEAWREFSIWRSAASRRPSWASYGLYWFVGFALAAFTPESVVSQSPFIQTTLNTMEEWIPAMHRYAKLSAFPDLIRFWIAAMWLLMPIFVVYHVMTPWGPQQTFRMQTMNLKQFLIAFAFVPVSCFLMFSLSFGFFEKPVPEQYSYTGGRVGAMTAWVLNSRFGLAVLGSAVFWAQAAWFGAGLRTIWRTLAASGRKYW